MIDGSLTHRILNALELGLVAWAPASGGCVQYANAHAMQHALVREGKLAEDAAAVAQQHHDLRLALKVKSGVTLPSTVLKRLDSTWYVQTQTLPPHSPPDKQPTSMLELIVFRRHILREDELIRRFQALYSVTDRQSDVLRHFLRGASTNETASALKLDERTVRKHQRDLVERLGLHHRAGIFRLADQLRRGE